MAFPSRIRTLCGIMFVAMDILFDLYQQSRINDARNTAQNARDAATKAQWDIDDLKRKADALTLACQALWEILRSQTGMSDEVILGKIQEIDLRDGKADGRITQRVQACPNCSRKNKASRRACLYCGAQMPTDNVFEKS